jgi:pimeloyl-ACP methyl ester carboxylesterase
VAAACGGSRRGERGVGRRGQRLALALGLVLAALLPSCALPGGGTGPDWQQRRLILIPGVCMDAAHLPPPPPLPPGLPQLPANPHLPSWLSCGTAGQTVNTRARAMATFGALIAPLQRSAKDEQAFTEADLRFFSYDPSSPGAYDPATTRQALAISAEALDAEFALWHLQEPRATFDIVAHSLGADVALLWAADYATRDDLAYVHAIVTLDGPVAGYPQPLYSYFEPYLVPLFGDAAYALSDDAQALRDESKAPMRWQKGPGKLVNPVYNLGNLRDVVVPAFVSTLAGADGLLDDFGTGPDAFNHGAVLVSPRALVAVADVVRIPTGPQLTGSS